MVYDTQVLAIRSRSRKVTCCARQSYLQNLLILLCVLAVNLLNSSHVVLEVAYGMLPRLQALAKKSSSLSILMLVSILFVGDGHPYGGRVEIGDGVLSAGSAEASGRTGG